MVYFSAMTKRLAFDPIERAAEHWDAQGWRDSSLGMATVTSVMRVQQVYLGRANAILRPLGLTFSAFELMMLLAFSRSGALPLGKVSERLQVNAATVTSSIKRLESRGLVRRLANPADRRGVLAELTDDGRKVVREAAESLNRALFASPGLDPEGCEELFGLLRQVRQAAGDF